MVRYNALAKALLLVPSFIAVLYAQSAVSYDIVYVRAPRAGDSTYVRLPGCFLSDRDAAKVRLDAIAPGRNGRNASERSERGGARSSGFVRCAVGLLFVHSGQHNSYRHQLSAWAFRDGRRPNRTDRKLRD